MSYYMQGDPSFLGALWGAAKGFVTGGWGGAVTGAIEGSHGHGTMASPAAAGGAAYAAGHAVGTATRTAVRVVGHHPYLSAAGAAAGAGALALGMHGHPAGGGALATGEHRGHKLSHLAKYGVRKTPSMNVCNPRALRRAIRRARGFEKLAMKSIRLTNPGRLRHRHFGGFKRKTKR